MPQAIAARGSAIDWFRAAPAAFLLLWSGGYIAARIGLQGASPLTMLALRYALTLLVLAPIVAISRPPLPRRASDWGRLAVVGLLIQFVYFGLCWIAIARISVAVVALILALQPIVVAILSPSIAGETIDRRCWLGLMMGLAGAATVILARSSVVSVSIVGVICAVGALFGMVAATLLEKATRHAVHPLTASAVQYAVGLGATLPVAVMSEDVQVAWSVPFGAALAYLVIGNSLISMMLLLAMICRGEVAKVSALFFLIPPVAATMAWIALDERLSAIAWLGMAVAALGVAIVNLRPRRRPNGRLMVRNG